MHEEARLIKLFKRLGEQSAKENLRYDLGEVRAINREALSCQVQMLEREGHQIDVPLGLTFKDKKPCERLFPTLGSRVLVVSQGQGYARCWLLGIGQADELEMQPEKKAFVGAGQEAKLALIASPKTNEVGAALQGNGLKLDARKGHVRVGNEHESLRDLINSLIEACKLLSQAMASANVVTTAPSGTFPLVITNVKAQPATITTKLGQLSTQLGRLMK